MSMRTIWVAIRAANYTDRATSQVGRNVDAMIKKQQALRKQMIATFASGILYTVMAGMIVIALGKIMQSTMEGRVLINNFNKSVTSLSKGLGEQLVKVLGPTIKMLTNFLVIISRNAPLMRLVAILMFATTVFLAVKGVTMLLSFALMLLTQWWATVTASMGTFTVYGGYATAQVLTLSGAFTVLKASLGPALLIFTMMYQVASAFGDYAWVLIPVIVALTAIFAYLAVTLWSAATALSILTFGAAAAIGVGAAIMAHQQMPSYQQGTRYVSKTGPAIVHEGEQVIPSGYSYTPPKKEVTYTKGTTDIRIAIGTVKTEADEEELKPLILKTIKDALEDKV